jgi:hypothetical protein
MPDGRVERKLAAILAADVVSYSRLEFLSVSLQSRNHLFLETEAAGDSWTRSKPS